jgi:hypothetical protein
VHTSYAVYPQHHSCSNLEHLDLFSIVKLDIGSAVPKFTSDVLACRRG